MESVKKASNRFRKYPLLLADCKKEATAYANCVVNSDNIKFNECAKQFSSFKKCLQNAAMKNKMKL